MRKNYYLLMLLALSLLLTSCGDQGTNSANKPSNAANNASAKPVDSAAAEAEIKKLMDTTQTALAKNDADAMEKVYADNYVLVNIDGSVHSRAERMTSLRSGESKYTAFAYSEPSIRVNPEGNGAIVVARLTMKGSFKGKPSDGDYRVTHVYAKTKDGWKLAGAQATKIEAAASSAGASNTAANTANASTNSSTNK